MSSECSLKLVCTCNLLLLLLLLEATSRGRSTSFKQNTQHEATLRHPVSPAAVAFVFMHKQNGCCNKRKLTANDICDMHHMLPSSCPSTTCPMSQCNVESATWHISVLSLLAVRLFCCSCCCRHLLALQVQL